MSTFANPASESAGADLGPAGIIARLDRMTVWSLSYLFIGIIGTGFLFTFYDIFDINVSFVQTCVQLKSGCTPENALDSLSLPVVLNLVGYVIGTLVLSPICDRIGRRNMLLITMLVTGLGSLYNALAPDYGNFIAARFITGIGIGADLAVVNVYLNEVAPRRGRAKFTAVVFVMSALGALIGIWLGLLLTTGKSPWPEGLPFALASDSFTSGWRWMYAIGAILALLSILVRVELPESPRWLVGQGRIADADAVVAGMEAHASRRGPLAEPVIGSDVEIKPPAKLPYREIFGSRLYRRRAALLLVMWFTGYITVYSYASGFTSVLTGIKYAPPTAGVIAAVGTLGFVASSVFMALFAERLHRHYWLPINTAITLVGALLVGLAGSHLGLAFLGSAVIFFGFNGWVSPSYALTAESFPTRARSTGFALVDGVGHIGGCLGIVALAPALPHLNATAALVLVTLGMVVASVLAQFAPSTRGRVLDEVSP
ncbi:MFS transporter [Nocardioides sp. DS6]|uniref:MFS transporter n=1 Tax=Nocardioides eburneus TaxID=3231482 RepID=A0ABV3T1W5_9ACTN